MIIGDEEYIIPALSLGQIKRFLKKIEQMQEGVNQGGVENFDTISQIIHAALSRNYPALTIEDLDEMLDMSNLMTIFNAVLGASGFAQGELLAGNVSR